MPILDIALESESVYRQMTRLKGLDWVTTYFSRLLNDINNRLLMFYVENYPAAFVIIRIEPEKWFIHELAIRLKYRHRGIVQQVKETAREDGIKTIQWERKHIRDDRKTLRIGG